MEEPEKSDPNYLLKLENAIQAKYGEETILHPRANWSEEKEREYLKQLREAEEKKQHVLDAKEFSTTQDGFLISDRLEKRKADNICKNCHTRSLKRFDTIYLVKYGTCYSCFIKNQ